MDRGSYWLWLTSAEGIGATTANSIWTALQSNDLGIEDFFDLDEQTWAKEFGLNKRVVKGLAERKAKWNEVVDLAESLNGVGVDLVALDDPRYPSSLRQSLDRTAPPLLYAQGNVSILNQSAIAIVGARHAGERGLALARSIGESAGRAGFVVVSGGARGVDLQAHYGVVAAGGATILVLSCGILRYRTAPELGELLDPQSALYLSELAPNMTWAVGGAMARNRIVCGLASAVVVVEAAEKGGTIEAAKTALNLGKPVFVIHYDKYDPGCAGNALLLRKKTIPLPAEVDEANQSWGVKFEPVVEAVASGAGREPEARQMDLF